MPPQVIDDLTAAVATEKTVIDSAIALILGFKDRVAAAVAAALAGGATPAQLAPLTDLIAAIGTEKDALAAAVAANTGP